MINASHLLCIFCSPPSAALRWEKPVEVCCRPKTKETYRISKQENKQTVKCPSKQASPHSPTRRFTLLVQDACGLI
jgi:hypothetical protein